MKKRSLSFFCMVLLCGAALWAQNVAQVSGTVRDSTGATVVGAEVRVKQTDTQATRSAVTGPDGSFVLPNLPLGPYELQVTMEGFTTYLQSGIVLQVNSNPQINPVLTVGSIKQQIEVQADAAMVETHDNSVGQVIDAQRVLDLPLNGRQVSQLITLSGASVINNTSPLATNFRTYPNSVAISVAGGQNNSSLFLLDGGLNMDPSTNVPMPLPFPDALLEFQLQTTALPAQYGYHPGAVVSVVTKSGGNDFHGSLFEFLRNGDLNGRNTFAPVRDMLKRNQFGGSIGGRVIENKLFFFAAYQSTIIKTEPATNTVYVPNAAVLRGDFSTITSKTCSTGNSSLNATQFPGAQVPLSRFNQQSLNILKQIPVSTDQCGKLIYGIVNNSTDEQGITKVDYQKSARQSIFARYFTGENDEPPVYNPANILTSNRSGWSDRAQTLTIGDTLTLSASVLNSFRITGTRMAVHRNPPDTLPTPATLGINVHTLEPSWLIAAVTSYFSFPSASQAPGRFISSYLDVSDDFQLIKGKHQFAFGGMFIHGRLFGGNNYLNNGRYTFGGAITGNALGDFVTGGLTKFEQGNGQVGLDSTNYIGLYAQDAWKLAAGLTVNVGLRWEPYLPQYSSAKMYSHFESSWMVQGLKSTVYPNAPAGMLFPGDKGYPGTSPTFARMNQFGPRLGIVWDPRGKGRETIRAGYGIVYDQPALWNVTHFSLSAPWGNYVAFNNPPGGFTNPYQGQPGGDPFPTSLSSSSPFPLFGSYVNYPLHVKPMYMQSWNLSISKQVGKDLLITANYIGNGTRHLRLGVDANPATYFPGNCPAGQYGLTAAGACSTVANTNYRRKFILLSPSQGQYIADMVMADDGATASYNGLLLSVNKRLSNNFTALVNYTWAHCLTEGEYTQDINPSYQDQDNRRGSYGNCVQPHQLLNASVIVSSPTFTSKWANRILGGWRLPVIIAKQSGTFATVTTGADNARTGLTSTGGVIGVTNRPDLVGDPTLSNPSASLWFNTAAFKANAVGTFGNVGVGTIRSPGWFNMDLSLVRILKLTEKNRIEFRAEAFNVLNHVRLDAPTTALNSANFGKITAAEDPRIVQLALKYSF